MASAQQKALDQMMVMVGEMVWIENNKRLINKQSPLLTEAIVEADLFTTFLIRR